MCGECGCGENEVRHVGVGENLLSENDRYAEENRKKFTENGTLTINLLSSPGSGKTTLLVQTLLSLKNQYSLAVIEGDQQTDCDAARIAETSVAVKQINTGKGCHLDAHMIAHALQDLTCPQQGMLFIENVGNLVCPAMFDLGETRRVVVLSVTEGEDKPLKYPDIFANADLLLINKMDLLPYVSFDIERCVNYAKRIQPKLDVILMSATQGEGLDQWHAWLVSHCICHGNR